MNKRGFTMVEFVIALAITAVLFGIILSALPKKQNQENVVSVAGVNRIDNVVKIFMNGPYYYSLLQETAPNMYQVKELTIYPSNVEFVFLADVPADEKMWVEYTTYYYRIHIHSLEDINGKKVTAEKELTP